MTRNRVVAAFTVVALVGAAASAGADGTRYVPVPVPAPPPNHLAAGNQYYEGSLSGFRDYLNAIRSRDPELFAAMDPRLSSLESKKTSANIAYWGGGILGLGLMLVPLFSREDCEVLSPGYDECNEDNLSSLLTFTAIGGAVMIGGLVAGLVLRPNRKDLMNLVNENNRLRPDAPVQLQLGYDPTRGTGYAGLTFHFE